MPSKTRKYTAWQLFKRGIQLRLFEAVSRCRPSAAVVMPRDVSYQLVVRIEIQRKEYLKTLSFNTKAQATRQPNIVQTPAPQSQPRAAGMEAWNYFNGSKFMIRTIWPVTTYQPNFLIKTYLLQIYMVWVSDHIRAKYHRIGTLAEILTQWLEQTLRLDGRWIDPYERIWKKANT